jgi:hypothetical protein
MKTAKPRPSGRGLFNRACTALLVVLLPAALSLAGLRCSHGQHPRQKIPDEQARLVDQVLRQEKEIDTLTRRIAHLEKNLWYLKKRNFSLLLTGDILLDNKVLKPMKQEGTHYPFQKIAPLLEEYDLVFANLETPITSIVDPAENKPYIFRLLPDYAQSLAGIRLDVVSLANNHILDQGVDGMRDTMAHLDDLGIDYCGAGENLSRARQPALVSYASADVCILAYCERPPVEFYAGPEKPGTAPLDLDMIGRTLRPIKTLKPSFSFPSTGASSRPATPKSISAGWRGPSSTPEPMALSAIILTGPRASRCTGANPLYTPWAIS